MSPLRSPALRSNDDRGASQPPLADGSRSGQLQKRELASVVADSFASSLQKFQELHSTRGKRHRTCPSTSETHRFNLNMTTAYATYIHPFKSAASFRVAKMHSVRSNPADAEPGKKEQERTLLLVLRRKRKTRKRGRVVLCSPIISDVWLRASLAGCAYK